MNDKQVAELVSALNGLNKTIMLQQQAKINEQKNVDSANGSRRRDKNEVVVKLDDNDTFKQLKGLLAAWHKEAVNRQRGQRGASPTANTEANRRLTGSISNLTKTTFKLAESFKDLDDEVEETVDSLGKLNRRHDESSRQHERSIMGHIQLRQELGKLIKTSRQYREDMQQRPAGSSGGSGSSGGGGGDEGGVNGLSSSITKALEELGFKVGSLMSGITGYISDSTLAMRTGSQFDFINTVFDAASMGLSSQEYLELGAAYRTQAMRLNNGTQEWMTTIKSSQRDLIAFTGGDMLKAAQIYSTMNGRLMDMGFGLDEAASIIGRGDSGYIGALKRLNHATGQTVEELDQFIGGILTSDQVRSGMYKLDRDQRSKFLTTQTNTIQSLFMMTGSLDRAKEMIDGMNKRQDMSGLDRVRDAVRASVAGRAMGLSTSESQRLMALQIKRPESLSQKEMEEFAGLRNKISKNAEANIGKGGLANEIFTQSVLGKLGQDLGELRTFNTSLDQPINGRTLENQMASSLTESFDNPQMREMLAVLEIVKKSIGSNLAAIVAGGFAAVLSAMGAKGLFSSLGGALGGLGGSGTGGSGAGGKSWGGGSLLRAGGLGIAALGLGYVADQVWQPNTPNEQLTKDSVLNSAQGAAIGAGIGSIILPGIGTAIGGLAGGIYGYFATNRSPIKLSAAEEQHKMQLTKLEKEFVVRKHKHELTNLDLFTKNMTDNEKTYFKTQINQIEDQYGVKIKSVSDLTKYENDELRRFVDTRSKMLTERQQLELDQINKKYSDVEKNYNALNKMNTSQDVAKNVSQLADSVHNWNKTAVSGEDLGLVLKAYDSTMNPGDILQSALQNMDPNKLSANGWNSNDIAKVMDAVVREKNIDRNSKEGKLAEALVWEVEKMATSTANQAKLQYEEFVKTTTSGVNGTMPADPNLHSSDIIGRMNNMPLFTNKTLSIPNIGAEGATDYVTNKPNNLIDRSKQRDHVEQVVESGKKNDTVQYILDPQLIQQLQILNQTAAETLEANKESVRVQSSVQSRKQRPNDAKI